MKPYRKNPWIPPWFSPEQTQAWNEMPHWNGKNAPFTEEFRGEWREWYRKWKDRYCHPPLEEAYREIDRQKAKTGGR